MKFYSRKQRREVEYTPSEVGVMRVKMGDGRITEVRGNRAKRRRIIKENKLRR